MIDQRFSRRVLGAAVLLGGLGLGRAWALPPAPKANEMAAVQPRQSGVEVSTLAAAELGRCRVEPYPNGQNPVGYVLLDASNRPVRRFVAVNSQHFNILSFYLEGEEVYRETDSTGDGKVDVYRWLGSHGSKIGRDLDGNGSIDVWDLISPEEVGREIFDALAAKDANRLKALLPTEAELKSLGLPAAKLAELQAKLAAAPQRFQQTVQAAGITPTMKFIHVEFQPPATEPADAFGGSQDLMIYRNGGVLYDRTDGKVDFISTGALIRLGHAWRVLEGPAAGAPQPYQPGENVQPVPSDLKPLVDELIKIAPDRHTERAAALEKIVAKLNGNPAQEQWMRQLIETYASAAEQGDKSAAERLAAWKDQIVKFAAKTPLAGFAEFRTLSAEFLLKLHQADTQPKMAEVQQWWREALTRFVTEYPNIEETAEALFRLGMAHEFNGKEGEQLAIGFYTKMAQNFPGHPQAPVAAGAAARLASVGKPFAIVGCTNLASGQPHDPNATNGKVTLVYFWGSFALANGRLAADAKELAEIKKKFGDKIEILTVTMDHETRAAVQAINAAQLPGTHLFSPNSALPNAWGIMGQHLFLLDKNGKVENKNAALSIVADEIEKLLK